MPTRIELLRQAGFSDDEIGDWAGRERLRMQDAGFTDREIDDDFGIVRPPQEIPAAFIERLKQGTWLSRVLGTAGEYAQNYFGGEPLGFSPEHRRQLGKFGIIGDLTAAAGGPVDALLRSVPAGIAAVGGGLGQLVEEGHDAAFGPGPYAKGKAARDFAQLGQIAALLSGAQAPNIGPARTLSAGLKNGPVIDLPRAQDFRDAAASITGTPATFKTEQKLLRLWTDHGIPPAEVAVDALHDRTIAETMRSDSGTLPEAYLDNRGITASTAEPSNASALPAKSVHPENAGAPAEPTAAAVGTEGESSSHPNVSEPTRMIAESKDIAMFDPPQKRQRPFFKDYGRNYKMEVRTDAQGRLLSDIEGRPLAAEFVAGRRFAGKPDQPVLPEDIEGAIDKLEIEPVEINHKLFTPNTAGIFFASESRVGPSGQIWINTGLSPSDHALVTAHEFGHAIDHFARRISRRLRPREIAELRRVYGTLRSGSESTAFLAQPEQYGYATHEVNAELMAEGLRAYLTNPNYFKTVAPMTAAKIREDVNESSYLKDVIQFNSLGAAGLIGSGVRNQDRDDQ